MFETLEVPVNNAHSNLLLCRGNGKRVKAHEKDKCVWDITLLSYLTSLLFRFWIKILLCVLKFPARAKREFQYFASNLQIVRGWTFHIRETFSRERRRVDLRIRAAQKLRNAFSSNSNITHECHLSLNSCMFPLCLQRDHATRGICFANPVMFTTLYPMLIFCLAREIPKQREEEHVWC